MGTVAAASDASLYAPARRARRVLQENEYIVINGTPRDFSVQWNGETIVIPSRVRAIPPHPKFSDVRHSFINPETGKLVPGTIVITDLVRHGELGEREVVWDAASFIKAKIGDNQEEEFGLRGLSWTHVTDADREVFRGLFLDAKAAFEKSVVKDAGIILWERQIQEKKYADAKLPLPPTPSYVLEAAAIVKKAAEIEGRKVIELLDDVAAENKLMAAFDGPEEVDLPEGVASTGPAPPTEEPILEGAPDPLAGSAATKGSVSTSTAGDVAPGKAANRADPAEQAAVMAEAKKQAARVKASRAESLRMK